MQGETVGAALAKGEGMSKPTPRTPSPSPETESTVVLVGGNGGLFDRYREALEERGLRVRHFEKRVPPGARRSLGRVAAIFVVVSMVSHSLRDSVKDLADDGHQGRLPAHGLRIRGARGGARALARPRRVTYARDVTRRRPL
jgi:hypothetical protein